MAMNVEAEIRDLKRRVSKLEGSSGFPTQHVKAVHKDLLTFQARTEQRFEKIDGRLDKIDGRLDRLDGGLRRLSDDMPGIVGEAIRAIERTRRKPPKNP